MTDWRAIEEADKRGLLPAEMKGALYEAQKRGLTGPTVGAAGAQSEFANRKSSIFPMSTDAEGNLQFDINAGIPGAIISGVTAPGDVAAGKLDPNSAEGQRRAMDFTALASPLPAATRATQAAIPGSLLKSLRVGEPKIPTTQELKAAGGAGFDAARQMGVDYSADAVKSLADDLIGQLERDGFREATSPKTLGIIRELQIPPAGPVAEGGHVIASLDDLIAARRTLQEIAGSGGSEAEAARRSISALDDFVVGADPSSVVAGPAAAASEVLTDARANYAAHFRSKDVEKSITKAEQDAGAANSGANVGNRVRQRLKSILQSDSKSRGYSKEELAFLADVVAGKHGANLARWASNFLGGGGGLLQYLVSGGGALAGTALAGPVGAAAGAVLAPAAGMGLRALSNRLTQNQARALAAETRMRSPLYEQAAKTPTSIPGLRPEVSAAMMRGLLLGAPRPQPRAATPAEADLLSPGVY